MADDENRLGLDGQNQRQQDGFPDRELSGNEDLPEPECQRRRPEQRPSPDRQVVPEQLSFRRLRRVHGPFVVAECQIERSREHEEDERRNDPPAAVIQRK
ncbi:MAG: hypothetical protein F4204_17070 [Rhodospirillaceae bacterium]|nr:hypothetical protein [Rhodospirillaceae bacterium]